MTAQLSGNQKVQLLERNEIEKVYREQGLSAANKDYLKLGRILGADGLLLLDVVRTPQTTNLTARLIAVKPGVVLMNDNFPWPLKDITGWTPIFASHLNPFLPKLSVLARDAIPISIVNLRSAIQSAEAQETERQLKLLAIQRLSQERQFFVLERQQMQLLAGEKELKVDESAFWNGSYLLEGVVDQNGYSKETITVNARLTPPKGGPPLSFELSGSRTNLVEVINRLAAKVTELLKVNFTIKEWNAADEARQYLDEAQWALKWGVFSEAQAAADSAWALGRRNSGTALLQIRAYGGVARQGDEIPAVPDASQIEPIRRTLDLFNRNTKLIFTNMPPDVEWTDLGQRTLRTAIGLLEGFYYAAEARPGHEEQLTELRASARKALQILSANPPSTNRFSDCRNFDWLKWEEVGICFEKPQDPLPMYRQMLETGYHPTHLPRVIGWSWGDRKSVPHLLKRWIEELCASTNTTVQLEGLYLALVRAPYDAQGHLQTSENELVTAMWEHCDWVLSSADNASLIQRTEGVLGSKYSPWYDPNRSFDHEPFASLRQRLRKEYLLTAGTVDFRLFEELFPVKTQIMSDIEAQELGPLVEQFAQKIQANFHDDGRIKFLAQSLKRQAGMATTISQTNVAPPALPAEKPMLVRFIRWNLKNPDPDSSRRPRLQTIILRGNKLWAQVRYVKHSEPFPSDYPTSYSYVAVDPETGACEEIPFPGKLGNPDTSFEVTEDSLFVSVQDHLLRYRFSEKTWEQIPVPMEGGAQILGLSRRLYLATANSLLEVIPDSQITRILVSSRRNPPANEMDLFWDRARLYLRSDGKLGVICANRCFVYTPDTRVWEQRPLPTNNLGYLAVPFFSTGGVQLLLTGAAVRRHLVGLWNDSPAFDSMLEHRWPGSGERLDSNLEKALADPRWEWPQPFDLEASSILAEGKTLWILNPRKVWMAPIPFGVQEPVMFADDRQATLFHFEPEFRRPISVPLRFEDNDQKVEPFDANRGGFPGLVDRLQRGITEVPFWLDTPQGLVFSAPALNGHWLISKVALKVRLQEQHESLQKDNLAGNKSAEPAGMKNGRTNNTAKSADSTGGLKP